MKKKLVLVVAVVLIAITACACLAGCVPNRPDKFVGNWIISEKKGVEMGNTLFGIAGGKMISKLNDENQTIFEDKGTEFNVYTCVDGNWKAVSMTKEEAEKNDTYKDIKKAMENEDVQKVIKNIQDSFEKNFTKEDEGWWNLKIAGANICGAKVDGNKMLMSLVGKELPIKLVLNLRISIPSGAKAALK